MTYCTPMTTTAVINTAVTTTAIRPILTNQARPTPDLFGVLFAEVVTPDAEARVPDQPGYPLLSNWEVRVWPVARLGDATLEARPLYPHLNAAHLRADLQQAGVQVLGPIREKR